MDAAENSTTRYQKPISKESVDIHFISTSSAEVGEEVNGLHSNRLALEWKESQRGSLGEWIFLANSRIQEVVIVR